MVKQTKNLASIVAYFTIIGWLAARFIIYPRQRNSLNRWHLLQAFVLNVIWLFVSFVDLVLEEMYDGRVIDLLVWISWLVIFMVIADGLILAVRRCYRPVIVFGNLIKKISKNAENENINN